ncbi:hypothetical protein, variant [Saprolegnia diclina VS20]|uniref:Uncharacterized protein n=1 Tax=Saprolegnia diclina (strain VS20) TaxID=1156394 RepID=T0R508_SAPDV|nr:hypothetical protein, variant [Saprolegnia diclina VS20]EQC42031.1 hypothetical protein, variant [Saprolegnia diclina VS20]|eukprot:XP_008604599.1 hypothetical protein, variant [Saprolegnia diclina VS20]
MSPTKPCPPAMSPTKPMTPTTKTPKALDRSVRTRSQFHITFPSKAFLDLETPEPVARTGWGSPNAIPYRPLGKPDLHMKLSPNLRSPHVLNESQHTPTKSAELRAEASTHYKLDFSKEKGDCYALPQYSPSHIIHLQCPHRSTHDPSFAMLTQAIHEGTARRCCVKYGASVFSHAIVPKTPSDVERTTSQGEAMPYLPYTTRKPQVPSVPQLPSFLEFRAKTESEAHTLTKSHAMSASQAMLENTTLSKASGTSLSLPNEPPRRSTYVADLAQSLDSLVPTTSGLGASASKSSLNSFVALHLLGRDHNNTGSNPIPTHGNNDNRSPHGVERLQDIVRARERTKQVFSQQLLVLLRALANDRWQNFCLKFTHFKLQRDLPGDLFAMRERAEADRQDRIHVAVEDSTWFTGYLSLVLKFTPTGSSPAPALLFLANSIRDSVNQGHEFQPGLLLGLVLCLYEDELEADATQTALKFLRSAAGVPLGDWERFFESANLPPPIEVVNQRRVDSQGKGKHMRMKNLVKTAGMMSHLKSPVTSED